MNAARRARQRFNERHAGGHTGADHAAGQRCPVCRPLPQGPAQQEARTQVQPRPAQPGSPLHIPLGKITAMMGKVRTDGSTARHYARTSQRKV